MLDATVEEVRLGFYTELGSDRVTELLALPHLESPTTDDGLTRLRAENVEYLWTRVVLMRRLPMLFVQGEGQSRAAWNEEGITREGSGSELRSEIKELNRQVRQGLAILAGEEHGDITATVLLPDATPPRPGESIVPTVAGTGSVGPLRGEYE